MLSPYSETAPDPGGADCVACGRCCHHEPCTVHLLETDDDRVKLAPGGDRLLSRLTILDDRPPGWRFMRNTGSRCAALDLSKEGCSRARSMRFDRTTAASSSPVLPAASKHGGSGIWAERRIRARGRRGFQPASRACQCLSSWAAVAPVRRAIVAASPASGRSSRRFARLLHAQLGPLALVAPRAKAGAPDASVGSCHRDRSTAP